MGLNLKKLIGAAAPALATALGGPLAGSAVKFLSGKVLGVDNGTEEDLAKAIGGWTPAERIKLQEMDNEYNLKLQQQGIDVFAMEVRDRESARKMAASTQNLWPQIALAIGYNLGFFVILGMLIGMMTEAVEIDGGVKEALILLLGVMAGELKNVNAFWVGSSYGSTTKTFQGFAEKMKTS